MEKPGTASAFPPKVLWSSTSLWVAVLYLKDVKRYSFSYIWKITMNVKLLRV